MASSLSTIVAKDGTPATIAGGILAVDKSGAGTGPFFAAQTIVDTQGVNTATVKAASATAVATDTSIVTQLNPNSPGIIPTGTAGSASATVLTVQGVASMTPVITKETKSATGTQSIVASSATSVTVLASNANRLGASVYNDSTQILFLLLTTGGTASATVYTVQMVAGAYYEVPFGYTGALIGIWASANGNARVMEMT